MENRRYVPTEAEMGMNLEVGLEPENLFDRTEVAEPETLLHLAKIVGIRMGDDGRLR